MGAFNSYFQFIIVVVIVVLNLKILSKHNSKDSGKFCYAATTTNNTSGDKLQDGPCPFHTLLKRKERTAVVVRNRDHQLSWKCFTWTEDFLANVLSSVNLKDVKRLPSSNASFMFPSDLPLASHPSIFNISWTPHFSRHDIQGSSFFRHARCVEAFAQIHGFRNNNDEKEREEEQEQEAREEEVEEMVDDTTSNGSCSANEWGSCSDPSNALTTSVEKAILNCFDNGDDSISKIGGLMAEENSHLFSEGVRFKFASPFNDILESVEGLDASFPFDRATPCAVESEEYFEVRPYIWIGEKGARTPTHYDVFNNIYFQLVGNKTFLIAPTSSHRNHLLRSRLHPAHRSARHQISNELASLSKLDAAEKGYRVITLYEGDILVLPAFVLHEVIAESTSVSVNVWSGYKPTHLGLDAEEMFSRLFSDQELLETSRRTHMLREMLVLVHEDLGISAFEWRDLILERVVLSRLSDMKFKFSCNPTTWILNEAEEEGKGDKETAHKCSTVCSQLLSTKDTFGFSKVSSHPSCNQDSVNVFLEEASHVIPVIASTLNEVVSTLSKVKEEIGDDIHVFETLLLNVVEGVVGEVVSTPDVLQFFFDSVCCVA
eukprot:m.155596 g.155596  ORF g.155596 m.155596 type:complete len:602 (-) comp13326_c0_seq2:2095-3900(-)